jgi:hypothetical protein
VIVGSLLASRNRICAAQHDVVRRLDVGSPWTRRRFRAFNVLDDFNREALKIEIDTPQYSRQKALSNALACMNRHDGDPAVRVTHDVTTTLDARHRESGSAKCCHELFTRNQRILCHAFTVTRWTPIKSSDDVGLPCSSRRSLIASRTRAMHSSSERACV